MYDEILWKSDFETGVEEIDLQHHYFAGLINRLSRLLSKTDDKAFEARLLNELIKYAQFHFVSEENLMYLLHYEGLQAHKNLHFDLLNALNAKIGMFQQDMIGSDEVVGFLQEWFVMHTLVEDKKLTALGKPQVCDR
jgi:hemerythrin